ncbi:putative tricarboxylic transport membrane protein [Cohaesibacter sp. ES.047]|uniref:tripartite tricarboxylate transporter permease n=1 Tax=Cohaesibacter sp. ES.047 TaxID=1798205 RepID=UPI000BB79037|nr:tripartite tricarboxylate transporter permease [Cohaesibacter sp. ES.047]SNY92371.1 putative tricarboxylic transport membrane protein [Cohaesibacter sp. ES.047]
MFDLLLSGVDLVATPSVILLVALGCAGGLLVGALPGLGPLMGIILLLPAAFYLPPVAGMGMLIAIYVGGSCGGAISAILLRIPGTPLAAATLLDGYPLAKKGRAGDAIGVAISASAIGGMFGGVILVFFAPMLASIAVNFGPPEYFALAVTGLMAIAVVSSESTTKGLLTGCLGILIAVVGTDPMSNAQRFTFGDSNLSGGIHIVAIVVGLFAISEAAYQIEEGRLSATPKVLNAKVSFRSLFLTLGHRWNLLRSSIIGTFFGALPGASGIIASFTSYAIAKARAKPEEAYGQGAIGGVVATESSNNACCGGALIPTLALAIPGDSACAVLMGALMLLGLQPGPQLFSLSGDVVGGVFLAYLLANVFLFVLGILMTPIFVSVLKLRKQYLVPSVLLMSMIGVYAIQSSVYDLWMAFLFGIVGYVLRKFQYPLSPIVIGVILGPIAEGNLRRSLLLSQDGLSIFAERPIAMAILFIDLIVILWAILPKETRRRLLPGRRLSPSEMQNASAD